MSFMMEHIENKNHQVKDLTSVRKRMYSGNGLRGGRDSHNGGSRGPRDEVARIVAHAQRTRGHAGNGQSGDVRSFSQQPRHSLERNVSFEEVARDDGRVATLHCRPYGEAALDGIEIVDVFGDNRKANAFHSVDPGVTTAAIRVLVDDHFLARCQRRLDHEHRASGNPLKKEIHSSHLHSSFKFCLTVDAMGERTQGSRFRALTGQPRTVANMIETEVRLLEDETVARQLPAKAACPDQGGRPSQTAALLASNPEGIHRR